MIARRLSGIASALMLAMFILVGSVSRGEEKEKAKDKDLDLDKIPKAVMDALKAKFPKAEIHKWTKEKEKGEVVYDLEFKVEGRKCEADIKEDGTIINFEKEIAAKDLPEAVKKALDKKHPKATIKEAMEVTAVKGKEEKLEGYEVVYVTQDKKKGEIMFAPDGKILEEEGDEDAKKEKKE